MINHFSTIWGDRIGLRPFEAFLTDVEIARVYAWSRDDQVLRWSGGIPTDLDFHEFRERLRSEQRNPTDNRLPFFIVTRSSDSTQDKKMIGRIGIFAIDWGKREGELGIVIGETSAWGKGFGREAINVLVRHVFQETSLERINLFTFPDNIRAQRCFTTCGFRTLGTARRFSPDIGEYDGIEMEITRREFVASAMLLPQKQSASR